MMKIPCLALLLCILNVIENYVTGQVQNSYILDPGLQNSQAGIQQSNFKREQINSKPTVGVKNEAENKGETSTSFSNVNARIKPQCCHNTVPIIEQSLPQLDAQPGIVHQIPSQVNSQQLPGQIISKENSAYVTGQKIPGLVIEQQRSGQINKQQKYDKVVGQQIPEEVIGPQNIGHVTKQRNYDQETGQRMSEQTIGQKNSDQIIRQQKYTQESGEQSPELVNGQQNSSPITEQQSPNREAGQQIPEQVHGQQSSDQVTKQKPSQIINQKYINQITGPQIPEQVTEQSESAKAIVQKMPKQITGERNSCQELEQQNSVQVTGEQNSDQKIKQVRQDPGQQTDIPDVEQYIRQLELVEDSKLGEKIATRLKQILMSIKNNELKLPQSQYRGEIPSQATMSKESKLESNSNLKNRYSQVNTLQQKSQKSEYPSQRNRQSNVSNQNSNLDSLARGSSRKNSLLDQTQQNSDTDGSQENSNQVTRQQISDQEREQQNLGQIIGQQRVRKRPVQQTSNPGIEQIRSQSELAEVSKLRDELASVSEENNVKHKNKELMVPSFQSQYRKVPSQTTFKKQSRFENSANSKNRDSRFRNLQGQGFQYSSRQPSFLNQDSNLYNLNRKSSRRNSLVDQTQQSSEADGSQQNFNQITKQNFDQEIEQNPEQIIRPKRVRKGPEPQTGNPENEKNLNQLKLAKDLKLRNVPKQNNFDIRDDEIKFPPLQQKYQREVPSQTTFRKQPILNSNANFRNGESQSRDLQGQRFQSDRQPRFFNQYSNFRNLNGKSSRNSDADQTQQYFGEGEIQRTSDGKGTNQQLQEKTFVGSKSDQLSRELFKNQNIQTDDNSDLLSDNDNSSKGTK